MWVSWTSEPLGHQRDLVQQPGRMSSKSFSKEGDKMKRLAIFYFALASIFITDCWNVASGDGFNAECRTLNPLTGEPQESFYAGDDVLLRLILDVPAEAIGKKVDVKARMSLKVGSLQIAFNLPNMTIASPYQDPGIEELGELTPFTGRLVKDRVIRIPSNVREGYVAVQVKAEIAGIGSGQCVNRIIVKPQVV